MKKLFLTMLSLVCLFGASAETLTVYDGEAPNEYIPIYGYYVDTPGAKSQTLYPASDLTDMVGKEITEMTFYANADITFSGGTQTVSLGEVQIDAMTGLVTEGLTQVFEGTVTRNGSQMTITFENPYPYAGGNLLLSIDITGRGTASHTYFIGTATEYNSSCYKTNYGSPTALQFLPKTTFVYATPADYAAKVNKESIAFGTSKLSELPKTETVTLRNMGANAFTPSVTFSNQAFSTTYVPAELAAAGSVDIPVVFQTSAIGEYEGTMTITAFEGEGGTFTVALTGNTYGGAVAPEAVDFGSTPFNKIADIAAQSVTLTNYSGVAITPAVTATAPFGSTYEAAEVANGASVEIPVTFTPDAKGEYTGTLTINAGAAGTYTVALTGVVGDEVYDITVCTGTGLNEYVPIFGYNYDANTHTSQMIYPAELLTELKGHKITSLTFYPNTKITITKGQSAVSLMETEQTTFEEPALATGNFTKVGTWVPSGDDETLTLQFTTPYLYRGGNLMVQFDKETEGGYQTTLKFKGAHQESNVAYHKNSAYNNNSHLVNFLPEATFGYDPEQITVCEIAMTPAGGTFKGLQNVKATVTPEMPEGGSIKYIFAEADATETPAEQDYPAAGVDVIKSGKLTFILRDANNEELSRTSGEFTITPLIGDVNGDGRVDVEDVNYIINIILGKVHPND